MQLTIPTYYNCVESFIEENINKGYSDKVALYYQDKKIFYSELYNNINKVGNFLKKLNIEQENRLFILLPDSPELIYSFFGAMKIGAVPVIANTRLTKDLYQYMLNDCRAKIIIIHHSMLEIFESIKNELNYIKDVIVVGGYHNKYKQFYDLLENSSNKLKITKTHKDDMAFWLYTSGTTGEPKGVVHLHHDVIFCSDSFAKEIIKMNSNDICLSVSKMFHSYGLGNSVFFPFRFGASSVIIPDIPKPDIILDAIEKFNVTLFFAVPTFYNAAINYIEKENKKYNFNHLRHCISGGETLPAIIYKKWYNLFNVEILDGIGTTEIFHQYLSNIPGKVKPGSVGFPVPGFEVKIVDENGKEVKDGEIGTMFVKGDSIAAFYWNKHEETKKQFIGEWFNTKDLFFKDSEGYYWYSGRADDAFKVKGEWIIPVEIERIVIEHPAVLENAIIEIKDENGLSQIKAFIVLKEGYIPSDELKEDIKNFVRKKLPGYKVPKFIEFIKELPKTATGKIQKFKLKNGKN